MRNLVVNCQAFLHTKNVIDNTLKQIENWKFLENSSKRVKIFFKLCLDYAKVNNW